MGFPERAPSARDKTWELLRRWPGLRGEAKIAAKFLWESLAYGQEALLDVVPADVAADQGTSGTSGVRCLRALDKAGLIDVLKCGVGRWTVRVKDPAVVARACKIEIDGQGSLFDDDQTGAADEQDHDQRHAPGTDAHPFGAPGGGPQAAGAPSAPNTLAHGPPPGSVTLPLRIRDGCVTDPPRPPLAQSRPRTREDLDLEGISTRDLVLDLAPDLAPKLDLDAHQAARAGRGSVTDACSIGAALADYAPPSADQAVRMLGELAASIERRVADPLLHNGPILRVANAVYSGTPAVRAKVQRILEELDAHRRAGTLAHPEAPRRFFIGACKTGLHELNVRWLECLPDPAIGRAVEARYLPRRAP
ncbi:MAG TPA: hypothetical protein VGG64_08800 [Pirellulales bacterium]|jgi:hypothetical protein